jgi:hypothetical protein
MWRIKTVKCQSRQYCFVFRESWVQFSVRQNVHSKWGPSWVSSFTPYRCQTAPYVGPRLLLHTLPLIRYLLTHSHLQGWGYSEANPCGICGRQSDTEVSFSPSTSSFPCKYVSTNIPYSLIQLSQTLYKCSNIDTEYEFNKFVQWNALLELPWR